MAEPQPLVLWRNRKNRGKAHLPVGSSKAWCGRSIPKNWKLCVARPGDPAICPRCLGALTRAARADREAGRTLTPQAAALSTQPQSQSAES